MILDFSLMSAPFVGLAVLAVLATNALVGRARDVAFLVANLAFLGMVAFGPLGLAIATGFTAIGYALVRSSARVPAASYVAALTAFIALFAYLRDYDILRSVLPDSWMTSAFAIAGLSFLFFRIVHAAIDERSGVLGPCDSLHFANYCLSFTTFLMGPIQRFQDFRAQWTGEEASIEPSREAYLDAMIRILLGFVKAFVLASALAPFTMAALPRALGELDLSEVGTTELWLRVYAFYPYLYLNFSGYCDVVIGIGALLGVRPPENFDRPFLATNVSDFWLRMHRSLTLWLTDYVFQPSYMNLLRRPALRSQPLLAMSAALMLTMVVSGLWHGTSKGFLLFGLLHGLYLIAYRAWEAFLRARLGRRGAREWNGRLANRAIGMFLTTNAVALAYVFFVFDAHEGWIVFERLLGLVR